ncbi:ribonuclease J [Wansuia hejianensis]|uniref:Ribonuclease J n=1 Tax=Wansuia hejianensis TaxID=2763667 RepID=A0A926IHH1_9FIRM|nr:ribonuclease J [Wansuia hejianensis]
MAKVNKLKIIPLGGLGEVGKNITVLEYKDDIVLIDCGMTFPEDEMLGVDIVIPDITYLFKNKDKIRGMVLTHGHEDHIGAIPYTLKRLNIPIYGTRLTLGLLETKLKEHRLDNVKLNVVKHGDTVKLGKLNIEFIRTGHSIPDSSALAIHTPVGTIVHSGDFKIDYTPISGDVTDLHRLAELGQKGVLALLADSTNAERPGYTMSESTVGDTFMDIFSRSKGRIIIATFASNVDRVQQIINAAELNNRKVVLSGRSMVNTTTVAYELGYLKVQEGTLIDINDMDKYRTDELVIITTGSQGEPMSALTRIAFSEHRKISLLEEDLVIISASPIPGNEKTISRVINKLIENGTEVIYEALAEVHVSGHARQEELKLIHTLVKPKFFMPVHGEFRHLKSHAHLAESLGMPSENIFILENGQTLELSKNKANIGATVPSGNILVDGLGVGDVGNIVLRDRKHLSEDGLIVVVVTISKQERKVVAGPDIISRGFVYVRESEDLMEESREIVKNVLIECEKNNITDWATLKFNIRDALRTFLYGKIKRNPMILPIIMEV